MVARKIILVIIGQTSDEGDARWAMLLAAYVIGMHWAMLLMLKPYQSPAVNRMAGLSAATHIITLVCRTYCSG